MKIYTRTGDGGETALPGGRRVKKNHPRVDACGAVDELNAVLGLIRVEGFPPEVDRLLEQIQNDLFSAGADLAVGASAGSPTRLTESEIQRLEGAIDQFTAETSPISGFILPGGTRGGALFHWARTVCRRAERAVVALAAAEPGGVSDLLLAYVNRLSDLFFVLARSANQRSGVADSPWRKP
ncbi:MAG: cob(I)yrinic acid a,c-diamide adenosyltransferase [Pirellulales bacterium]|nr:cob(I)yrinic acid a,c-diamide adenosyltransferase [Pirellulales bacterium]